MAYFMQKAVQTYFIFLLFINVADAQQKLFRLSCHGTAIFKLVGQDQRCSTGILQTRTMDTMTSCYQWCVSVNKCIGANVKEETQGKVKCELVGGLLVTSANCKLANEVGWQYFEAVLTYASVVLEAVFCKQGRNSRCTMEEKLNPELYIPFRKLHCGKTTLYGRGQDEKGQNAVTIDGAYIEMSTKFSSGVTMVSEPTKHHVGNFGQHPMTNPRGYNLSVSMWIKVSSYQRKIDDSLYFGCGDVKTAGFYIRHTRYGKSIAAGFTDSVNNTRYYLLVSAEERFGDWKHLVLTVNGISSGNPVFALYINGTSIAGNQYVENLEFVPSTSPYLTVGYLEGFHRFAYWNRVLSPEEIAAVYNHM